MSKQELVKRELTIKDLPKLIKYMKITGIKDKIYDVFFDKPEPKVKTWGELRAEVGMTKEELDVIKHRSGGDLARAVRITDGAEHLVPEEKTQLDLVQAIIDLAMDALDEDVMYKETITLLADLYDTTVAEVETRPVMEIYTMIKGVMEDESFPKP